MVLEDLGSGHRAVTANINVKTPIHIGKPHFKVAQNFKDADWENFLKSLEAELQEENIDFTQHPSQIFSSLNVKIFKCAKIHIPRGSIKNYKCFWSKDLQEIKKQRDELRRTAEQ